MIHSFNDSKPSMFVENWWVANVPSDLRIAPEIDDLWTSRPQDISTREYKAPSPLRGLIVIGRVAQWGQSGIRALITLIYSWPRPSSVTGSEPKPKLVLSAYNWSIISGTWKRRIPYTRFSYSSMSQRLIARSVETLRYQRAKNRCALC